jgi:hypothetical protein
MSTVLQPALLRRQLEQQTYELRVGNCSTVVVLATLTVRGVAVLSKGSLAGLFYDNVCGSRATRRADA